MEIVDTMSPDAVNALANWSDVISDFGGSYNDISVIMVDAFNLASGHLEISDIDGTAISIPATTCYGTSKHIRSIHYCEYCGTSYDDEMEFVSNCKNCGAVIRR